MSTFHFPRLKSIALAFPFLLLLGFEARLRAQGFTVQNKSAPSVVNSGTFVSLDAKFSIALPQNHNGFRELTMDTPLGRAPGFAFNWIMKEGAFTAGYLDAPQAWNDEQSSGDLFALIRDELTHWAGSKKGKLTSERKVPFGSPAVEFRVEFPNGLLFQRFYFVSRRRYQTVLFLKSEQRPDESVAVKVLDTFKVLSDVDVNAALKAKVAEAEPAPLPQEPVATRIGSDAADSGLRGKVKSVFEEAQDLSNTWSVQGRKPESVQYYSQQGNLTREESYDYKGNLSQITVHGYIDGARVSNSGSIRYEYNPPPMMINSPPGVVRPKSDPRYSTKVTFEYDNERRLIGRSWFRSNGELTTKAVYKYSGNPPTQRETRNYSADGSLNRHELSTHDPKGNEVEKTDFNAKDGSVRTKYSYAYEFDAQGNWIKRTTSKWVTKDGKSYFEPSYVDYRTVTYY